MSDCQTATGATRNVPALLQLGADFLSPIIPMPNTFCAGLIHDSFGAGTARPRLCAYWGDNPDLSKTG